MNTGTLPPRPELSEAQRALLNKRLQHAREAAASHAGDLQGGLTRRGVRQNVPLSSAQQRLWFIDQLEPGSPVYNMCEAVRLRGPLNLAALERGLNEIIRRHELLRANIVAHEGTPVLVIAEQRTLAVVVREPAPDDGSSLEARVDRIVDAEARRPFDLRTDPLLRVLLVRVAPEEHVFMLTMHHIISDGWSMGVFFDELAALYEAAATGGEARLPELPVQYTDYVLWEKERLGGHALDRQLAYWKHQLRGRIPVLELPFENTKPSSSGSSSGVRSIVLPPKLAQALKDLSQREGATLFMTLLAGFQVLLHRYTGETDVVTGSVVAGRSQVALEKLIGFFVNTLVLRGDLSGDPTFRALLGRIQGMTLDALAHQDLPFTRVVEELRPDRNSSRNPLFNVMFVLQNTPPKPPRLHGLEAESKCPESVGAKFDLTLMMTEAPEGLYAAIEYNADRFTRETIARMLGHLQTLLEGIVADPDCKLSQLPVLTASERRQVLSDWNRTTTAYPRDRTIDDLFREQAAKTPKAVAVTCGNRALNYRELDEASTRMAARLRQRGVGPDVMVGVCLERSVELIVALLAVIKAGGAYVSLDPSCPVERLSFMLQQTKAPVLLTISRQEPVIRAVVGLANAADTTIAPMVIRVDEAIAVVGGSERPGIAERPGLSPDNLAYVSYTSGSTGTPKGVAVTHRGVVRLVKETNFARFGANDVFLQLAPVAFDASTLEIWAPLLNGGKLVVFPPGQPSLSALGECVQRERVTVLWLTAGLFHQMVEDHLGYLKDLRLLLAGGDVLSVPLVARALQQLPRTQLINGYGPTENTTFTCCHLIAPPLSETRSVPIGRPIANTQVYILDAHCEPVPVGVPGELYTGGDGLARGYLNQPALTAEKFVTLTLDGQARRLYKTGDLVRWSADGTLEFLGRIDRQVKIRGYRVEPAEIETALLNHPSVKQCAVAVGNDNAGGKRLVAAIVLKPEAIQQSIEWAEFLRRTLPDYMVPSAFMTLETLPLSSTGKVDQAAILRQLGDKPEQARARVAPRDETEQKLAAIWEEVLGLKNIGVHDRFFELGGHSLLAVRLLARVEVVFGQKLPVSAVFQQPTVAQLAELLRSPEPGRAKATSIVEIQPNGTRPAIYLVHGVGGGMFWGYSNLSRHLGPDQPVMAFKSRGADGLPEAGSIEEMAASYIADLKRYQARGPYILGGYCFGGNVAYEMARQLKEKGDDVSLLVLISCSPPNSTYSTTGFRWSLPWMARFARNTGLWLLSFTTRWDGKERRDFVRWKWRLLRQRVDTRFGGPGQKNSVNEIIDLSIVGAEERSLWDAHMQAQAAYRPKPYDGKTVLLRSREHLFLCSFDHHCGWTEYVKDFAMKIVPGDHGRVLEEPYVAATANALRRILTDQLAPVGKGGRA